MIDNCQLLFLLFELLLGNVLLFVFEVLIENRYCEVLRMRSRYQLLLR